MNTTDVDKERIRRVVKRTIERFSLNLEGLTVFTEAATGNYLYTPIMSALAGSDHVFAVTNNSKYGKKDEVKEQTLKEAKELGVEDKITVLFEKDKDCLSKSDVVTNSGFVRPITKEMVSYMKPTAVIPLMFAAKDFCVSAREDIALEACHKKGVIVLGTNEHHPLLNLYDSVGFYICKLLFEKNLSVFKNKLLLIGSGDLGNYPTDFFIKNNVSIDRITFDDHILEHQKAFVRNRDEIIKRLGSYDAIIVAELYHNIDVLSNNGFIPVGILKEKNPLVQIIHITGSISKDDVLKENLALHPKDIKPFGYMSVYCDYLGPNCTMECNAASLKVGEVASRCRLKGISVRDTINYTLKNSPADAAL